MGGLVSRRKEVFNSDEISFDHFQVLRAIGRGSFGKVCIVQKRDTRQMYAMKYMNKTQCEARDALSNVFREIEILASLNHPFLVNLWFSFQDSEDMFMVVDLLLGGDLRYHLQQGVSFADATVRLYVMEVASALAYLHARHIIHRDIKPDNLLLDEEGHVHLTDFNIATVLRSDQLATSMSGTKPYMAPEVFECAADTCSGYDYAVDWWSLGVTAYEVRRGRRPFDIHSSTCLSEIRHMFLHLPRFPSDCHPGLVSLISALLTVNPEKRVKGLDELRQMPYAAQLTVDDVVHKRCKPEYTPPKDHLNCDPTFELEEMIIEARPLHKKKKRLSKQKSIKDTASSLSANTEGEGEAYSGMLVFNREQEEAKKEREKREREWQAELEESMRLSDPTGHGCTFTGTPTRRMTERSDVEGEEDGEGEGGGGRGELGGEGVRLSGEDQNNSNNLHSCSSPPLDPPSPLSRTAVSPSNVRARIAGSPKVKVRGSTVTIESPRSSSSLTKSSTQHLKERLRELQDQRQVASGSHSSSQDSDLTRSHDLTLSHDRSPQPAGTRRSGERSRERSPQQQQAQGYGRSGEVSRERSPQAYGRSHERSKERSSQQQEQHGFHHGRSRERSLEGSDSVPRSPHHQKPPQSRSQQDRLKKSPHRSHERSPHQVSHSRSHDRSREGSSPPRSPREVAQLRSDERSASRSSDRSAEGSLPRSPHHPGHKRSQEMLKERSQSRSPHHQHQTHSDRSRKSSRSSCHDLSPTRIPEDPPVPDLIELRSHSRSLAELSCRSAASERSSAKLSCRSHRSVTSERSSAELSSRSHGSAVSERSSTELSSRSHSSAVSERSCTVSSSRSPEGPSSHRSSDISNGSSERDGSRLRRSGSRSGGEEGVSRDGNNKVSNGGGEEEVVVGGDEEEKGSKLDPHPASTGPPSPVHISNTNTSSTHDGFRKRCSETLIIQVNNA